MFTCFTNNINILFICGVTCLPVMYKSCLICDVYLFYQIYVRPILSVVFTCLTIHPFLSVIIKICFQWIEMKLKQERRFSDHSSERLLELTFHHLLLKEVKEVKMLKVFLYIYFLINFVFFLKCILVNCFG